MRHLSVCLYSSLCTSICKSTMKTIFCKEKTLFSSPTVVQTALLCQHLPTFLFSDVQYFTICQHITFRGKEKGENKSLATSQLHFQTVTSRIRKLKIILTSFKHVKDNRKYCVVLPIMSISVV